MKLRNKKTGEVVEADYISVARSGFDVADKDGNIIARDIHTLPLCYSSVRELTGEFEDYEPVEPIFDAKIRKGVRAWWDMQDNPFKAASVLCYKDKDLDGFYHWRIFGYIREGEQKESTDLCFRTKKLYEFDPSKDYTKEELCGEEEE